MTKPPALASLLTALALGLSACGGAAGTADAPPQSGTADSSASAAPFNDADVEFVRGMIPHHEQALVMSRMAGTHGQSAEVKELAADIEAAQDPEIEQMTRWLKAWGQPEPDRSGHGGHDMDGDDDMGGDMNGDMGSGGMMTYDQMAELDRARGAEWDQMFLTMMIAHHEGAIEMARTQQAEGKDPDALKLAEQIEESQAAEVATMKALLDQ